PCFRLPHFPPRQKSASETPATLRTRKCVAAGGRANRLLVLVPDFPPTMTTFASDDPRPRPDTHSPGRFLWWLLRGQGRLITSICLLTVVFLLPAALAPWAFGRAIDEGVIGGDTRAFATWVGLLAVTTLLGAAVGGLHHYLFGQGMAHRELRHHRPRNEQDVTARPRPGSAHANRRGAFRRGSRLHPVRGVRRSDGTSYRLRCRLPHRRRHRGQHQRSPRPHHSPRCPRSRPPHRAVAPPPAKSPDSGAFTTLRTDVDGDRHRRWPPYFAGHRGRTTFAANYEKQSGRGREVGVRAGVWSGTIDAAGVLLSGIFVVGLMILGVREVKTGSLSVGALVTFLGYALFLLE